MFMPFRRSVLTVSLILASAILPAGASTLTITSIKHLYLKGATTSAPFDIPDGNYPPVAWTGVGATVTNSPTVSNLAVFGSFSCLRDCVQEIVVDFTGTGFQKGYTLDLSLAGFASRTADVSLFAHTTTGGNSSLNLNNVGNGSFTGASLSQLITTPGDFTGQLYLTLSLTGGNLSLPQNSTADLFVTPTVSAVPEPATVGIVVGSLGLLVFVRRLRKS